MPDKQTAIISSTARDLPEYRDEVMHGCLRLDVFPKMMEHLPALDADAIAASLALVDKADIYIGIFAHRYGYVPKENNSKQISITEMEYDRAVERKLPRLIFLMDENHPVKPADVDKGASAEKLEAFKRRLNTERVRDTFTTKEDLRGKLIQALSELKKEKEGAEKTTPDFHPPNIIPKPPEPYIAHPYSLLQTKDVVGRQAELNLLTDWVTTNKQVPADTRIFNLVAIGGMGKSALTWKWFNDIAPNELPKLAGRMWWSFYESDAHWENFIIRALAYVSGQSEKAVRDMKSPDREDQLWRILDQQPFLLVLDGLERILLAYARMDAAQMPDDDLDEQTANRVAKAHGLPESAGESFIGKHQLRRTADHRAGQFLRRLARLKQSRILITTRLYPAELQTDMGDPLHGCFASFLTGLKDDDALDLWREFKVSGSTEQLLLVFKSFGNYPLLIRALAGEVAAFRPTPGDFDKWRHAHPQFNPAVLPLKNAKTHVLEFALRGLSETQRSVLHTLAAFRMPATWDTLSALLIGEDRQCAADRTLDAALTELEDRGLISWDKKANRYDLHPIVRSVVWAALSPAAKQGIFGELHTYFEAAPKQKEWEKVESLDAITPAIELYHTLIGLQRFQDAFGVFRNFLEKATLFRLAASRERIQLLEQLFPDGLQEPPRLEYPSAQGNALNSLALSYRDGGQPGCAVPVFQRCVDFAQREGLVSDAGVAWRHLSNALRSAGALRQAEVATRRALEIARQAESDNSFTSLMPRGQAHYHEGASLYHASLALATSGNVRESDTVLRRSLAVFVDRQNRQMDGMLNAAGAQCLIWGGEPAAALPFAWRAWELAQAVCVEADCVRASRLHGEAALGLGDLTTAEERLHDALTRAQTVHYVEEELPSLRALAELHRKRKEHDTSSELLEQVWSPAERGPYPLFHADALNVLAQIERDQGNREAAIAAATKAYTLAWCDGPPYAYHYGLTNALKHLQELGAPEPQLPPFDESKFEPMPDVELNPKDEFWVDPDKLDS